MSLFESDGTAWIPILSGGGGGSTNLSHADNINTDGKFWLNGTGSATLAAGATGYINFGAGDTLTNDPTTFTTDQYDPTSGGVYKSVHGIGVHTVPGTYNFQCGLIATASSLPATPWAYSIPYQLVNLLNTQWSGPDQSGQYMTFVPQGTTSGFWQALFYQRLICDTDTISGGPGGGPAPFTLEIDNPSTLNGGFTLNSCYAFMAIDKIADDDGGFFT